MNSVQSIAMAIDHALLQPLQSDYDFDLGCEVAKRWKVAAVCVKSADVGRAQARMLGSPVAVCAVAGFPHANVTNEVLCLEVRQSLELGAREIDVVVSMARVLSDDWDAVRRQIELVNAVVAQHDACLKVIFETGLITEQARKVRLCEISKEVGVAFVKTSTGFAFGRSTEAGLVQLGATIEDVRLLVEHASPSCRVKASGGIRTLAEATAFLGAGAARIGTASTDAILREAARTLPLE